MAKENLSESLQIAFSLTQIKEIKKLAGNEILTPAAFARKQLVKTLKLKKHST